MKDPPGTVVASRQRQRSRRRLDLGRDRRAITSYTYTISAGADVRPATLPVPGPPRLAITGLKASPHAVTPNGDWSGERTRMRFGLTRRATLGARVVSAATDSSVRTLLASSVRAAGRRSMTWDGTNAVGPPSPTVATGSSLGRGGSEDVSRSVRVVVDRTLGGFFASPKVFSPNGDGEIDRSGSATSSHGPRRSGCRFAGRRRPPDPGRSSQAAGDHELHWNGRAHGARVADGSATVVVRARSSLGTRKLSRRSSSTRGAPSCACFPSPGAGRMRLRLSLSERARLRSGTAGSRGGTAALRCRPPGRRGADPPAVPRQSRALLATDAGLNRSRAVVGRAYRSNPTSPLSTSLRSPSISTSSRPCGRPRCRGLSPRPRGPCDRVGSPALRVRRRSRPDLRRANGRRRARAQEQVGEDGCALAPDAVGGQQRACRHLRVRRQLLARLVHVETYSQHDRAAVCLRQNARDLAPVDQTSLGHLICAASAVAPSTVSATATPPTSESSAMARSGGGLSTTEQSMLVPGGASRRGRVAHVRPSARRRLATAPSARSGLEQALCRLAGSRTRTDARSGPEQWFDRPPGSARPAMADTRLTLPCNQPPRPPVLPSNSRRCGGRSRTGSSATWTS